jgi:hypothetical protein
VAKKRSVGLTVDVKIKLNSNVLDGLRPVMRRAALEAKAYAEEQLRAATPVRTGRLASNWVVTDNLNSLTLSNKTPYAGFVEYGTRFMRARPMATAVAPRVKDYYLRRVGYNAIKT